MGFLNNTSVTVDAVLTKKGRELLARGQDEFKITKFALSDDEIDYRLWDTAHPNGSNYYGSVIENMPLLEAFVDENQVMRFKLVSLPKNTAKLPILEVPSPSLSFNGPGIAQTLTPNTRNGSDAEAGYSFILHDATIANLTPVVVAKKRLPETPPKRAKRAWHCQAKKSSFKRAWHEIWSTDQKEVRKRADTKRALLKEHGTKEVHKRAWRKIWSPRPKRALQTKKSSAK